MQDDQTTLNGYPGQCDSRFADLTHELPVQECHFVRQPNGFSWGAACFSMVLKVLELTSAIPPWSECITLLHANDQQGTSTHDLEQALGLVAKKNDLAIESLESATVKDLKRLNGDNWVVIVSFREPVEKTGHFAVLQAINDHAIMFADPFYGRCSILELEDFDWNTQFETPPRSGWFCALRSKVCARPS